MGFVINSRTLCTVPSGWEEVSTRVSIPGPMWELCQAGMTKQSPGRSCHVVKNHDSGPKSSWSIHVRRYTRSLSAYGWGWNFQIFNPSQKNVIYHLTAISVGIPRVGITVNLSTTFFLLPILSASCLAELETETDRACVLLGKSPLRVWTQQPKTS